MRLPEPVKTPVLLLILGGLVSLFTMAACSADVTGSIRACEYVAKPLADSTAVVTYRELPCFDATIGRVVRGR